MLGLKEANALDEFYSGQASDLNRNLGYAGLALVWIFKKDIPDGGDVNAHLQIPTILIVASASIVASLLCDWIQYIYGSLFWGRRLKEEEAKWQSTSEKYEDHRFQNPTSAIEVFEIFWKAKLILMAFAYLLILIFLMMKMFW